MSAIAVLALAVFSAPATAGKGVVQIVGQAGTGDGDFTFASGVAVNQGTGDVYVVDAATAAGGGQRILQFNAAGVFVRAWGWGVATGAAAFEVCTSSCREGIPGSGDGQFAFDFGNFDGTSPQIAIDQVDGSVYVADNLNDRVQKFTASGAYVAQFGGSGSGDGQFSRPLGIAVDPISRDVYVADANNNRVQRFDSTGAYVSQVGVPGGGTGEGEFLAPTRLAVDSTGRLYVLDSGNGRVQRFTDGGAFDQVFAAGAYSSPRDLTVDPADDHVYVAAFNADLSVNGILEFDPAGAVVDTHAGNTGIPLFSAGMAVRSSTGRIYASSPLDPKAVLALDDVSPPTVVIDPVSDITATTAVASGAVNPQGPPATSYRFEYSLDGTNWVPVPSAGGVAVGGGTSDVPVAQMLSDLAPNTEYRVRLVATKDFNAASATSSEVTFTTATMPPLVRSLAAGVSTDTAVWLGASVNPRNLPTRYYVEYTLSSDVGYAQSSRVPAAPETADVGEGNEFVELSQLVTGLTPGTNYRFRVVASNAAGTTEGPDRTFSTQTAAPQPPPGRKYEMVSPLDKNGGDVDRNVTAGVYSTSGVSSSGDAVAYAAQAQFAEIPSGAPQSQYRSVRNSAGWTTRGISPPIMGDTSLAAATPAVWFLSEDLAATVVSTNALLSPNAGLLGGSWGLYLQRHDESASTYELLSVPDGQLSQEPPANLANTSPFSFAAASRDMRHVVFESDGRQLAADGPPDDSGVGIYEWSDGQLRFVSELPSGEPAEGATAGQSIDGGRNYPGDHVVSDDGQRVFFTAGLGSLYVREAGTETVPLSVSERAGDDETVHSATFQAAKADDGSLALFTSNKPLTTDAKAQDGRCAPAEPLELCHDDLYLWDANAPAGQRLKDLTVGDETGGGVLGIAAVSDDLSRVYFVAASVLAPGGVRGEANLYVWTPATGVRHIARSVDSSVASTARDTPVAQFRDARISKDGSRLLFTSSERLTGSDSAGHKQAYLYDFAADRTICVSCESDGSASKGPVWLFYPPVFQNETINTPATPLQLPRNLSADGSRVFFETAQRLVSHDTNGKADVYQWLDGELSLISSGKGTDGAAFIGASASGDDVFFTTRERLVGADVDDQIDVYDARVGGGIPEQQLPPPCVGDACQGLPTERPSLPGSDSEQGAGDPPVVRRPSFSVGRVSAKGRRALARGRKAWLTVRVNKAGRIALRGTARVGNRSKTVLSATRRASRGGRLKLPLKLSARGRSELMRSGRLKVTLRVRFTDVREGQVRSLNLVSAKPRRSR